MLVSKSPQPPKRVYTGLASYVTLKVHCGCGVSFQSVEEGEAHAQDTNHILHITGQIRPIAA